MTSSKIYLKFEFLNYLNSSFQKRSNNPESAALRRNIPYLDIVGIVGRIEVDSSIRCSALPLIIFPIDAISQCFDVESWSSFKALPGERVSVSREHHKTCTILTLNPRSVADWRYNNKTTKVILSYHFWSAWTQIDCGERFAPTIIAWCHWCKLHGDRIEPNQPRVRKR